MPRRPFFLAALLILSTISVAPVSAQDIPIIPGIEITCVNEENVLDLEPNSGGAQGVAFCTISNPSTYTEDIEIDYDGDGLSVAGPETLTLASGAEETIQVSLSSSTLASTVYNMTVSAQVIRVNGSPELFDFLQVFLPSDESNVLAQVAEFVDLTVTAQPTSLVLSSELMQDMTVAIMIANNGNVEDNLAVTIQNSAILDQRNIGWNITNSGQDDTIDPDGGSVTYTLRFTPNPDMVDESFSITVQVKSGFSNSESVDITLSINTTAPEESILDLSAMNIPAWAYIAGGTLGILFLFAIVMSISKRAKVASQSILDEMEDEGDDDFDLADLDDALSDDTDDDDDLDDIDLDDFEF